MLCHTCSSRFASRNGLHQVVIIGGLGLLRSPSQASQLLHRSWWLQGIWKAGAWGLRGENKKGPPFGEPFLILRMVPAPGVELMSKYLIFNSIL